MADKKHNRIRKDSVMIAFDVIKYILLTITSLLCVLPFVLIVSGSITSNETILREGYSILPRDISFDAYSMRPRTSCRPIKLRSTTRPSER